jgi:mono/diheme cytochrome c family protein
MRLHRWIRFSLVGLACLLAAGAAAFAFAVHRGDSKRERTLALPAHPVALRDDESAIARGRYLYESRGCAECHGQDGAGRVFIDDAKSGMRVAAPNISPGPGTVVTGYRGEDWERTLRHGVKPDGHPLMVMPAEDYSRLTDDDVAAVVAYVRHLPPVAGGAADFQLPLIVRALYGADVITDAAQKIDHTLPPPGPVAEAVTADHGRYVGQACRGCHGPHLSGGAIPGAPPDWPAAANLTPGEGSALRRYPDAQAFKAMLRSGRRPDGSAVSPVMPFAALGRMNDVDIDALYVYLNSLEPRKAGAR